MQNSSGRHGSRRILGWSWHVHFELSLPMRCITSRLAETNAGRSSAPIATAGCFSAFLEMATKRFHWSVSAWVLMTNHYHLVIQTPEPNLSCGMHWLNGT